MKGSKVGNHRPVGAIALPAQMPDLPKDPPHQALMTPKSALLASIFTTLLLTAGASAQTECTQLIDNTVLSGAGGVSCVTPAPNQFNAGNQYLRRYKFPSQCNPPIGAQLSSVNIGHALAQAGGGAGLQPAEIRLYTIPPAGTLLYANMTLLRTEAFTIADGNNIILNVPLTTPVDLASIAGVDVVVELFIPDGIAAGHRFFPGINASGENAPSFIAATGCGIANPVDLVGLGFPTSTWLLDLIFTDPPAAVVYCTAGTTTNGCNASISSAGLPSASATSGYTITISNVEGAKQGLIFYGISGQLIQPWGTGSSFLCIKSPSQRLPSQVSGGIAGQCNGVLTNDWLAFIAANPGAIGTPLTAGTVVQAQGWFRDPPAPKSTSLSNAIEFTLIP